MNIYIVTTLLTIKKIPIVYLWKKSLTILFWFIDWYQFRLKENIWLDNWDESDDFIFWEKFKKYIYSKITWKHNKNINKLYYELILEMSNWDEEVWVDLFFKLLDEFIEKEWIQIDI